MDRTHLCIIAIFALAGLVKGVIGLGLPTVAMGLLVTILPPVQAAAVLILPSFVTNVWQMSSGPALRSITNRLWPMMLAIAIGTWMGAGLMTGTAARFGSSALGAALAAYAVMGLLSLKLRASKALEPLLSPAAGAATGLISAATGVFVVPAVPYLQAIGLEKDELVQALGLAFTISTIALAVNVGLEGGLEAALLQPTLLALAAACAGMWAGQRIRVHLSPTAFRTCFFAGLLLLGVHLIVASAIVLLASGR